MMIFTKKLMSMVSLLMISGLLVAQTPFWTEDFADSLLTGWTPVMIAGDGTNTANWFWTKTGPNGSFPIGGINSTTKANGWVIFDSDLNCSGNQDAWLVSPKFDMSARDEVTLQFQTHYRRYNDRTWIEVSTDSLNWTAIEIFETVTNNQYANGSGTAENPFNVSLDISQYAANQSAFWFAFRFQADPSTVTGGSDIGCAYSWQIDDVVLLDFDPTPPTDLKLHDWFYAPSSFAQPESQIKNDTFAFFSYVSNIGSKAVPNVVLKAEIKDVGGNVIFVDSVKVDLLDHGVKDSLFETPNIFVPNALGLGDYTINYSLYSLDSLDVDLSNNSASIPFAVTEKTFAKENGLTTYLGGLGYEFYVGAIYNTSSNWVDEFVAVQAAFGAAKNTADGPLKDHVVKIVLLEVDEEQLGPGWGNFTGSGDYASNPSFIIRSINEHVFTATGTQAATETEDLYDFDTDEYGVALKPGNRYVLLAQYDGDNAKLFHGYNSNLPQAYFPSSIVYTSDNDTWYLGGWQGRPAIYLRMDISLVSTTDERALPDNSLNFYPNPVSSKLNVQLSLENPTLANVTLADLNGRVIQIDEIQNAYKDERQYDVSSLPNGVYIIRVATKEGTKTKKFVVQH